MTRFRWSDMQSAVIEEATDKVNEEFDGLAQILEELVADGGRGDGRLRDGAGAATGEGADIGMVGAGFWGQVTEFEDNEEARVMEAAVIRHCNVVAWTLAHEPGFYGPVLEVDERTEEVLGSVDRRVRPRHAVAPRRLGADRVEQRAGCV